MLASACVCGSSASLAVRCSRAWRSRKQITLNSFKSSTLWPIWVAQKQGFFAKQGIAIKNVYTPNSVAQMIGLIKGEFDMVTTALDNVIAYDEGEGVAEGAQERRSDRGHGRQQRCAQPDRAPRDQEHQGSDRPRPRGRRDLDRLSRSCCRKCSPRTASPGDYKLVPFGNTGARWKAMQESKAVAGLLAPPVSQAAVAQGYVNLGRCGRRARRLSGHRRRSDRANGRRTSRTPWSASSAPIGRASNGSRRPPTSRRRIDILRAELPETTPGRRPRRITASWSPHPKGFDAGGKLDLAGAKHVLELRRQYGPQGKTGTDIARFIDESYFERAAK